MSHKSNGTAGAKLKNGDCDVKDHLTQSLKGSRSKTAKKCHNSEDIVLSSIFEKLDYYVRKIDEYPEPLKNLTGRLLNYLKNLEAPKKINDGWRHLVTILNTSNDPETIRNIVQIINCQLSSRQGYRSVVNILINIDICSALLKCLHVVNNASDREILLLEIHALIANLAAKDPDFASKVNESDTMKITVSLMKCFTENLLKLRPLLMVLKLSTADYSFSSAYGKLGVLSLLLTLINSLGRNQSATLKLVLEILAQLTKSKCNSREVIAQSGVRLLFNQLQIWEKTDGLNKLKILKAILVCLGNLTELKSGINAIYDVEGLGHLYRFCHGLPELSDYDAVISLATIVAHRCLPPKWLPIETVYGAVTTNLPANIPLNINLQAGATSFSDNDDDDSFSSSDDGETSTVPDLKVLKPKPLVKELSCAEVDFYKEFLPELEILSQVESDKCTADIVNVEISTESENCNQRRRFSSPLTRQDGFPDGLPEVLSCISLSRKSKELVDCTCSQASSKRQSFESDQKFSFTSNSSDVISYSPDSQPPCCDEKTRISNFLKNANFSDVHTQHLNATKRIAPFVKIAYPELKADKYFSGLEALHQKSLMINREMLLKNLDLLYGGVTSKKIVYDYETSPTEALDHLSNDDISRLGKAEDQSGILHFESRFECGNLRRAIMLGSYEYELILNPDINSDHHHQWFYFEVSNMEAGVPYSFYITNCEKNNSQFNFGMKPLVYSVREATLGRPYWVRDGRDICYFRNYYSFPRGSKGTTYFTTHFTISFQHPRDVCYIAYHYPYSYSLLQTHLYEWENCHDRNLVFYKKQMLCSTLGGNDVPILTITSNSSANLEERPVIFLTARVHPGETNASWVMKGTIDFLLSDRPSAESVRKNFIFKIIPMLNPDGVINGCHRCSLNGMDLNRCWLNPDKNLQPTIYYTKRFIVYLRSIGRLPLVYCDYHGHSRRKNIFIYGCNSKLSWLPEDRVHENACCDVLPKLLYQLAPAFSLNNCSFTIEQNRESTARITLWRECGIKCSYTMESSYCGCDQGPYKDCHLGIQQLREMGIKFCQAILHLHAKTKDYKIKDQTRMKREDSHRLNESTDVRDFDMDYIN